MYPSLSESRVSLRPLFQLPDLTLIRMHCDYPDRVDLADATAFVVSDPTNADKQRELCAILIRYGVHSEGRVSRSSNAARDTA